MSEPVMQVGRISHVGISVKDCEKTAAFMTRMFGIGPFDIQEYAMEGLADYYLVDGKPHMPKFKVALFYDGDFFLEIIEVTEGETVHTRFLRDKGEGMQHLCFLVKDTKAALEKLKAEGIEPVIDYQMVTTQNGKKVRIHEVYLNTAEMLGGTTIQFLEYIPMDPSDDEDEALSETERNKAAARKFIEGMSQDFAGAIDEAIAEDCKTFTMGTTAISGVRGKAEALAAARLTLGIFPEGLPTVIHTMLAEGDRVTVEAESFATHVSGKPYNNQYLFLMRFRDGKLIELKEYLDTQLAAAFFG